MLTLQPTTFTSLKQFEKGSGTKTSFSAGSYGTKQLNEDVVCFNGSMQKMRQKRLPLAAMFMAAMIGLGACSSEKKEYIKNLVPENSIQLEVKKSTDDIIKLEWGSPSKPIEEDRGWFSVESFYRNGLKLAHGKDAEVQVCKLIGGDGTVFNAVIGNNLTIDISQYNSDNLYVEGKDIKIIGNSSLRNLVAVVDNSVIKPDNVIEFAALSGSNNVIRNVDRINADGDKNKISGTDGSNEIGVSGYYNFIDGVKDKTPKPDTASVFGNKNEVVHIDQLQLKGDDNEFVDYKHRSTESHIYMQPMPYTVGNNTYYNYIPITVYDPAYIKLDQIDTKEKFSGVRAVDLQQIRAELETNWDIQGQGNYIKLNP